MYIPKLRTPAKELLTHPRDLMDLLFTHFTDTYNIPAPSTPLLQTAIDDYIRAHLDKSLPPETRRLLEQPITETELTEAIKRTPVGKAPGPDGLPLLYYKTLREILDPQWLMAFNSITDGDPLTAQTLMATVTLIPKPGKDTELCGNYRPISLLNQDVKLFAKILATRLSPYIPQLIHTDQSGFIPGREGRANTVRAINLIHLMSKNKNDPMLLLSTDAEKAFDRVSWRFHLGTLRRIGLGQNMMAWVGSLYSNPSARLNVNGALSPTFRIKNGTRQGCPLSPLLFALTLEPFLQAIRSHPQLHGIPVAGTEHRVAAYADDMLFFVRRPMESLPHLIKLFAEYSAISNLRINMEKSEILPINVPAELQATLKHMFPFRWCNGGLKYLGITLTATCKDLFHTNYKPFLTTLTADLQQWSFPHISWFGRINVVKMNILLRVLYLFQALPILLPPSFFAQLRTLISTYVWNSKKPRISLALLMSPKQLGGVALPHFWHYYLASHLQRIMEWSTCSLNRSWFAIEQRSARCPLSCLPWLPTSMQNTMTDPHPLIHATLRAWRSLKPSTGIAPFPSPLLPLQWLPAFSRSLLPTDTDGQPLPPRPKHFLNETGPIPCDHLPIPHANSFLLRFHHHRLIQSLRTLAPLSDYIRPLTQYEMLIERGRYPSHCLSLMYNMLQATSPLNSPARSSWERKLNLAFDDHQWSAICQLAHTSSTAVKVQEANYKVLTRWHKTPQILSHFADGEAGSCWRCKAPNASALHIWWDCPVLSGFWRSVHNCLCEVTEPPPPFAPEYCLLNHTEAPHEVFRKSITIRLLHAARLVIPMFWRKPIAPPLAVWLCEVENIRSAEERVALSLGKVAEHYRSWHYWLNTCLPRVGRTVPRP
uniref:Reverse transcriptase domain-containing protein n=1 Tax=Leptobrachium leishanense TaxID=445787 RepID=A0A8C5LTC3_9ANUR